MKASELRVGNWIRCYDHEFQIGEITELYVTELLWKDNGAFALVDLEPIPLTEEWLIKFGFEEFTTLYFVINNMYRVNAMSDGTWYFGYKYDPANMAEINYVHQLQNLYYFITQKELILK